MNIIQLTGRLTKAARIGEYDGTAVTNFTAAVEIGTTYKMATIDGREQLVQVPATSYFECSAWGPESAAASQLEAGQEVSFEVTQLGAKARQYDGKLYADTVVRVKNVVAGAKAKGVRAESAANAESIPF